MNPIDMIMAALQFVATIPAVGPILAKVIAYSAVIMACATALVGVWHGVIAVVTGLSAIPGLSSLASLAAKLQLYDTEAEGILNSYILPLLNRLSALPLPQKAPAPAAKMQSKK